MEKTFTLAQFRTYLSKQDSFGDAMYNLTEEKFLKAIAEPINGVDFQWWFIRGKLTQNSNYEFWGKFNIDWHSVDINAFLQRPNEYFEEPFDKIIEIQLSEEPQQSVFGPIIIDFTEAD